ncbi:MAG: hypothetical protein IH841_04390 [Thaumarchaeota archaeon]|nr:hypothetical protein [Nitrososphaerota archaeon]
MNDHPLEAHLRYHGISPWEIEVIHGYLSSRFKVIQEELEPETDSEFVTVLNLDIPLPFNEKFFQWFELRRWEKIKALFKEMKRRRSKRQLIKIQINFSGSPKISFIIDSSDKYWYNNSVEKIDFVIEMLPYHLAPEKLPSGVTSVIYKFDSEHARWGLKTVYSGSKKFEFKDNTWKVIT